ncbi:MAG: hypothetical protein A3H51_01490 [Candidatus Spechtbacteria bacterium RIFCSPLOWO2_02_FULL_38_8]|uniref:Bacterial sugar transferase domain-containing protein n=1 Tax=Candidatus Spechtbacteria bacterium RIFCSPLOWO2_02_FULL_38_8 TaxID=1802164 RepID=A0A1G2HI17_9BACT|nr:MAG: hypothetical protein A3H51_01490 [Candidatus Spechtbacteria bacterium RIFCSPLOWO2_02_FULL_38_8]
MRRIDLAFNLIRIPLDFLSLIGAGFAAYFVRISPIIKGIRPVLFNLPLGEFFILVSLISVFFMFIFALSGLYLIHKSTPILQEISRVGIALSAGFALLIAYMFFNLAWFDSRFILLASWGFAVIFVNLVRLFTRGLRAYILNHKGIGVENLLVLGDNKKAKNIKKQTERNKKLGFNFVDILEKPDINTIKSLHKNSFLHRIIVVDANLNRDELMQVVNFCEEQGIQFSYIPDTFGSILADMSFDILDGLPVVSIKPSPLDGWGKVAKRFVDIIGASILFVVLSPVFLVIILAIKWDSKGPVLVKLKRISSGKEFNLYKFRSMIENAESLKQELMKFNERRDGPLFKMTDDPRITKVGKILRAHRFDEFPQLFNVLKGEVSLVGPRPHEPQEVEQYKDYHKKVLAIKSGITGLAQVSGASDLPFDEEVKLDRYYIENWSLKKDIAILLRTVKLFLFDRGGV